MNSSSKDVMNRTKVSTYFRLGSQQDAGRRELSSTAPWRQQSNQNSSFASKEGEVSEIVALTNYLIEWEC